MSGISRARALELAREYFDVKDKQLDELLCAVLRVDSFRWPLYPDAISGDYLIVEELLRHQLASTRALFADVFRVSAAPR